MTLTVVTNQADSVGQMLIQAGEWCLVLTVFVTLIASAIYVLPRLINAIYDNPWWSLWAALLVSFILIEIGKAIGG